MFDLSGQVAVVTGGNGGIGLGMAEGLAAAGADICIWGRNEAKNAAAREQLAASGRRVEAIACDVSDEHQVDEAMGRTLAALGQVDAFFANAGISGGAPFAEMSLDEWRRVTSVNLDGAFLSLRAAARHMVERGEGGALVAVSSVSAIDGAPRQQHYAASKTALLGMVRGLAVELARHRIRVNGVLPGWIDTDMLAPGKAYEKFATRMIERTPVRRWGTPADLGPVAVFLADKSLEFHTGDHLVVDGGYTIF
jgi:NAD(P)-dependent dehydrogenase (short-subunit alcohol dehydrogenase family)